MQMQSEYEWTFYLLRSRDSINKVREPLSDFKNSFDYITKERYSRHQIDWHRRTHYLAGMCITYMANEVLPYT